MKEPQRIKLTDFVSSQKEPNKLPLKSLQDEYDMITTIEGARILVKKDDKNTEQNDS
jgi:hypothetical protein